MARLEKKYDATPLQVLTDSETRQRLQRLKEVTGKSQAQIFREILERGLPAYEAEAGLGPADVV